MMGVVFFYGLLGDWGYIIVILGLVMFVGFMILGWLYYGEWNIECFIG